MWDARGPILNKRSDETFDRQPEAEHTLRSEIQAYAKNTMDMSIPSNNENDDKNKKDDHNNNKSNKKEKLFDERRSQWDKHYDATTRRLAKAMSARQGEALDDLVQVVKKRRNPSKNDDIAKLSKKDRMGKSKNERAKMREAIAR